MTNPHFPPETPPLPPEANPIPTVSGEAPTETEVKEIKPNPAFEHLGVDGIPAREHLSTDGTFATRNPAGIIIDINTTTKVEDQKKVESQPEPPSYWEASEVNRDPNKNHLEIEGQRPSTEHLSSKGTFYTDNPAGEGNQPPPSVAISEANKKKEEDKHVIGDPEEVDNVMETNKLEDTGTFYTKNPAGVDVATLEPLPNVEIPPSLPVSEKNSKKEEK